MKHPTRVLSSVLVLVACATAGAATAQTVTVIAQGLDNPRGLGFAPNGELYVAEAGSGGPGPCRASPEPGMPAICYGESGALTRVDPLGLSPPVRVLRDLPSMAGPGGFAASSGPVDVDFFGMTAFIAIGWGGDPALRAGLGGRSQLFGTIVRHVPAGGHRSIADISSNEVMYNPAGGPVDSNPYGILVLPGRRIVADAGANVLIESLATDSLLPAHDRTLALLPRTAVGAESVPTSVIQGPDGYLYVGQLTGAPFFRGTASVWRVPPQGGTPDLFAGGFSAIVDLAMDAAGTLYVVEIASGFVPPPAGDGNPGVGNGRLLRKRPGEAPEVVLAGLVFPAGVAIGPEGALYLTNFGIFPGGGQVLRITLD